MEGNKVVMGDPPVLPLGKTPVGPTDGLLVNTLYAVLK